MLKPKPPAPELPEQRSSLWWLRWLPAVVVIVLLLDLLYLVGRLAFVRVLASFALAYLVNPIVYQIEKRGVSRPVAALAALLVVTLVAAGARCVSGVKRAPRAPAQRAAGGRSYDLASTNTLGTRVGGIHVDKLLGPIPLVRFAWRDDESSLKAKSCGSCYEILKPLGLVLLTR